MHFHLWLNVDDRGLRHWRPLPKCAAEWACSSVVEHCVDIAGVASSILATPTIFLIKSIDCFLGVQGIEDRLHALYNRVHLFARRSDRQAWLLAESEIG